MVTASTLPVAPHLSLFGFMDKKAAQRYLSSCDSGARNPSDLNLLHNKARFKLRPNDAYPSAGYPQICSVENDYPAYWQEVQAHQDYRKVCHKARGINFCLIELAPLIAFQIHVNEQRVAEVTQQVADAISQEDLLSCCLPLTENSGSYHIVDQQPRSITVVTPDPNVLGLRPVTVSTGTSQSISLVFDRRTAFVMVARIQQDKCYLKNGYHRACGIGMAGHTQMPCLLIDYDDYDDIGIEAGHFPKRIVTSVTPPTLGHFLDGRASRANHPLSPPQVFTASW
jgi:hypothetical protein